MEINLTLKHLGYVGLAITLGTFGLVLLNDPAVITAGGVIWTLIWAGIFAACLKIGRDVDRTRERWTRDESPEWDERRDRAVARARTDAEGVRADLHRTLELGNLLPRVMYALSILSAVALGICLLIPLVKRATDRAAAYREGIRESKVDPPDDTVPITQQEMPELFAATRELAATFNVAMPDEIRVSPAPTAYVFERAAKRAGRHPRVLVIGLPLIKVLSVSQLSSVLAHELAHLANDDVTSSRKGYQVLNRIGCILEAFDKRGIEPWVFRTYQLAVRERADALGFACKRAGELHADALSAKAIGARSAADALMHAVSLDIDRGGALHEFMAQHAATASEPPPGFVRHMTEATRRRFEPTRLRAELLRQLCRVTTVDDEHPALADRIASIGAPVDLHSPGVVERLNTIVSAFAQDAATEPAATWLDHAGDRVIERADAAWRRTAKPTWEQMRFLWNDRVARIEHQEQDVERGVRTAWLSFERARIVQLTDGDEAAIPWLEHSLTLDPENSVCSYALGVSLFNVGRFDCEEHLIRARFLDPASTRAVLPVLAAVRYMHDDARGGDAYRHQIVERRTAEAKARDERSTATFESAFEPVAMDPLRQRRLVELLWSLGPVSSAWMAKVPMRHLPDEPMFAISLEFVDRVSPYDMHRCAQAVHEFVNESARGVEQSVVWFGDQAKESRRIREVGDSLVFTRIAQNDYQRLVA